VRDTTVEMVRIRRLSSLLLVSAMAMTACSATSGSQPPETTDGLPSSSAVTTAVSTTTSVPPGWAELSQPPSAPAGANFTLTPTNPVADQEATVSASGCPTGDDIWFTLLPDAGSVGSQVDYNNPEQRSTSSTAPTTYHFAFPKNVVGPVTIQAGCKDPHTGTSVFDYEPLPAVVGTARHLNVSPSTAVAAGTTITVTPAGPKCSQPTGVEVTLELSATTPPIEAAVSNQTAPNWQASIPIPASLSPGTYRVVAQCLYSRSIQAAYAPTTVQVTAGGG
jgi:hypothetical protein